MVVCSHCRLVIDRRNKHCNGGGSGYKRLFRDSIGLCVKIYNIADSSNGRTHPSGGWYWGSSPWSAARASAAREVLPTARGLLTCVRDSKDFSMLSLESLKSTSGSKPRVLWSGARKSFPYERTREWKRHTAPVRREIPWSAANLS